MEGERLHGSQSLHPAWQSSAGAVLRGRHWAGLLRPTRGLAMTITKGQTPRHPRRWIASLALAMTTPRMFRQPARNDGLPRCLATLAWPQFCRTKPLLAAQGIGGVRSSRRVATAGAIAEPRKARSPLAAMRPNTKTANKTSNQTLLAVAYANRPYLSKAGRKTRWRAGGWRAGN
jgi:hypothetical protein